MLAAKRVAVNTGFLYARMGITLFISLYATRLILNALGAEDFGLFNVVGGAIAMLTFLNAAMAAATQRFMSYAQGEGNTSKQKHIFNVSIILHIIIGICVVLIIEGMGYFLFDGILKIEANRLFAAKMIFHFLVVSTFFTIISVPYDAIINANENMLVVAIIGVFEAFLKLIVAFYITYTHFDKLISYGLLMATISILLMVIQRIFCHLKYEEAVFNPRKYYNKNLFKEMTHFAGWSFLNSATSIFGNYGLGIVLNNFWGAALNAAQGIAGQLNGQLLAFSNTMMRALNPGIVKAEGSGERDRMLKIAMIGCKFSFLLFSFFTIPFLLETPYILKLWLKNIPDWTIIFCRLQILRTLIEQLTLALDTTISAHGKIKRISIVKSLLNLIPLPVIYFLYTFGSPPYIMYVVSIIIWAIIGGIITIYFTINNCNLKFNEYVNFVISKSILTFFIPFIIGLILVLVIPDSLLRLFVVVLVTMGSFIASLYFIGLTSEEKSFAFSIYQTVLYKIRRKNNI